LERRTARFASDGFRLCTVVRCKPGGDKAADQLQRASSAVAANYRASGRSRSSKEFLAKIGVVNEEADETVFWLEYIRDTKLDNTSQCVRLYAEATQLRAIFAASYRTARENIAKRRRRGAGSSIIRSRDH
jgi:four helix bundle protein